MSIPPSWNDSHLRVGVRGVRVGGAAYVSAAQCTCRRRCAPVAGADRCARTGTETVHFTFEVGIRGKPIAPGR